MKIHHTNVKLPIPEGTNPTYSEHMRLASIELDRPWVACVSRDGHRPYFVCGDTREAIMGQIPRARSGPNGPIDGHQWLRENGVDQRPGGFVVV